MSSTTEAYPTVFTESMTGIGTWTAPDAWASESELGEFMHGLVRLLKPERILETGCYNGDTTFALASAAKENGAGRVWSVDIDHDRVLAAMKRCAGLPATIFQFTGEGACKKLDMIDLAFLDSSGDRVAEAKALRLSPRGIVVLHDARRDTLKRIVDELGWQYVFVSTPRGTAILQPQRDFHALP